MLLDEESFIEFDKFMIHHCSNFEMDNSHTISDGIVSGHRRIDNRRQIFVYSYDFTVYVGTLGTVNAKKM